MKKALRRLAFAAMAAVPLIPVQAQDKSEPSGVLNLSASASSEIANDTALITVFVERQAADAEAAAQAVSRVMEQATRQAKQASGVDVRTGGFNTYPSYDRAGRISGWRSRGELLLESKDFPRVSALAAQLNPLMQISNLGFFLSRDAKQREENRLIEQAATAFREKAAFSARAFGYSRYALREVSVSGQPDLGPIPRQMRAMAPAAAEAVPVPLEGGRTPITVTVSGSVQMLER